MFGGPRLASRCGQPALLTPAEAQFASRTGSAPWRRPRPQMCVLQQAHAGPHAAAIVYHDEPHATESDAWWLLRDTDTRRWAILPLCPAWRATNPDYDTCQLPKHHDGHHSWLLYDAA